MVFLRKYKLFLKESKFSKEIQASNSGGFLISFKRERERERVRGSINERERARDRERERERERMRKRKTYRQTD